MPLESAVGHASGSCQLPSHDWDGALALTEQTRAAEPCGELLSSLRMHDEPTGQVIFIDAYTMDPTSVHPDETKAARVPTMPSGSDSAAEVELCQRFRHGFWRERREQTLQALRDAGKSRLELERFAACGATGWLFHRPGPPEQFRIGSSKCRNRWCEACAREKRIIVCRNLRANVKATRLRLMTLTLRHSTEPLNDLIDKLYSCWDQLRKTRLIQGSVAGGVAFLEVTRGTEGRSWHPHLHVLWEGRFIPQDQVSKMWKELTGDSWIVDLRPIGDSDAAARYVAKYASKSIPKSVWNDHERFVEVIQTFQGRRTFNAFGSWRKFPLSKVPEPEIGWERICPLSWLIRAARHGSTAANLLLRRLNDQIDVFDIAVIPDSS